MKDINIKTFTKIIQSIMTCKYKIEGNFDFYAALHAKPEPDAVPDESMICLITRLPLLDDHVVMECGHKFNYLPLYNGLVQNTKSSMNSTFRNGQISCPFCRHSQKTLLPFNPKFKKVVGVNVYPFKIGKDAGVKTPEMGHLCKLANLNECTSDYSYKFGDNHYCESHHTLGSSIEKQQTNYAIFLAKKVKADNKKALKAASKAKAATKAKTVTVNATTSGCKAILKSGPRKGQMCMCAKTINDVCARHTPKESSPKI